MSAMDRGEQVRFGQRATKANKRNAGRTDAASTPLELHMHKVYVDDRLRAWIEERAGRQLGKYSLVIERVLVLFEDQNGSKGGIDSQCTIQVTLSALPPVVSRALATTPREAFDRAMASAERSTRRTLLRHGFSARHAPRPRAERGVSPTAVEREGALEGLITGSTIGRRVGHARQNLLDTHAAKARRPRGGVDTSEPETSASDRRAGAGATAERNVKLNTAGMTSTLEDSSRERPSRKSRRKSHERAKPSNPLERRAKRAVQSPKARAQRNAVRS